jgi:hypothetical protein
LRCEQLGHQFERRELDEVYRRFVVLADRIKKVQDSHLLELIQDVSQREFRSQPLATARARKFPPAAAPLPFPYAHAASAMEAECRQFQFQRDAFDTCRWQRRTSDGGDPFADHHGEQEDYLWGV